MSYIGNEETQKEAEFFSKKIFKEFSITCITGDLDRKLGYAVCFKANELTHNEIGEDSVYLSTARGDFRMFKTSDAAVSLLIRNEVSECSFFFDPR